jgi:hypothetical protein
VLSQVFCAKKLRANFCSFQGRKYIIVNLISITPVHITIFLLAGCINQIWEVLEGSSGPMAGEKGEGCLEVEGRLIEANRSTMACRTGGMIYEQSHVGCPYLVVDL